MTEAERLERNKNLARRFMELVTDPTTAARARQYLTDDYKQHNPNLPDGPEAILNLAGSDVGVEAKSLITPIGPPLFIAEGDMVVMAQPLGRPDPTRPGETYIRWWFDMWRVEGDRLAEHWDGDEKQAWSLR